MFKIIIVSFFLIICFSLNGQNLESAEIKQDTIFEYFDDGNVSGWYFQDSISTTFMQVLNKGLYSNMYGKYIPIEGSNEIIKIGTWKMFTQNGTLKDSIIYQDGVELYRARFNNDGSVQLENKSGSLVLTNEIVDKCEKEYIVQFKHRNRSGLDSMILPTYQEHGFYIIENGVYDFIVNGNKHFQSVVLDINNKGFHIAKDWSFENGIQKTEDPIFVSIESEIKIRLLSINNGVGGIPTRTKTEDYEVQIIESDKYCRFRDAEFMSKDGESIGHYYFTQYGLKYLKMKNGKPYLCEITGDYVLRRK